MSLDVILKSTFEMIEKMEHERKKCAELVTKEPESEEIRRIVTRSLFSIIEGMCYRMKLSALLIGKLRERELNNGARAMVDEETYYLDENGEVKTRPYYSKIKANLRFAFKVLACILKSDFELDVKSSDFEKFQKAVDIRNRLTHPKGVKDLRITQDEFNLVTSAYDWFVSNMRKLFSEIRMKERVRVE